MKTINRTLPYRFRLVNAAALDVADAMSRDATRDRDTGQILATVKVYGNESRVAFSVSEIGEERSGLCITLLSPAPSLSEDGQSRTLTCLADSMEQLLENTFAGSNTKEIAI